MPLEIVNRTKAAGCMQNNGEVWVSVASFALRSAADACNSETAFETFAGRPAAIRRWAQLQIEIKMPAMIGRRRGMRLPSEDLLDRLSEGFNGIYANRNI